MARRVTLKTRVHGLYHGMENRFGPKYWKSGKRKGKLREPGRELPFTEAELLEAMEIYFKDGDVRCPYCDAPLDALSCSIDHRVPVARGGVLHLINLDAVCESCNRLKGALLPDEFSELMEWIRKQHPAAQQDVLGRLKAGAMGMRLRYYAKK